MGCFTRFRRTWRPGYSLDVIDPNKAFDFERRVIIFKKVVFITVLLALLIGLIYFVVYSLVPVHKNDNEATNTPEVSSLASENIVIKSGSVIASLPPTIEDKPSSNTVASSLTNLDPHNTTNSTIIAPLPTSTSNDKVNSSITPSPMVLIRNLTHHQNQENNSNSLCSSTGNVMQCIALSKSFKTIMTFNSSSNHTGTMIEGYVMVKVENSTWHPYCYPNWTLEMGYSLCKGFGFQQLVQLQTINIYELNRRISHKLGKDVSLHPDNSSGGPDLLVLTTENGNVPLPANNSQFDCQVGHISCN